MPGQFADMFAHRFAFLHQELIHRPAQALMGDIMRAIGLLRHIAAQQFVLALRAGLDLVKPRAMAKSIA